MSKPFGEILQEVVHDLERRRYPLEEIMTSNLRFGEDASFELLRDYPLDALSPETRGFMEKNRAMMELVLSGDLEVHDAPMKERSYERDIASRNTPAQEVQQEGPGLDIDRD